MRKQLISFLLIIAFFGTCSSSTISENDALQQVKDAIAKSNENEDQVKTLIKLAWFDTAQPKEVSQAAKKILKEYGRWSKFVLSRAVLDAPTPVQKEMIPFILWAYDDTGTRYDLDYIGTFTTLIRMAERDVKIMAMDALAKYAVRTGSNAVIDAAYEDPSLELHAIRSLGFIADPKAAGYLMEKMASPQKEIADAAEKAFASIASEATLILKRGLLDDRKEIRERSLRTVLPYTTIDDISLLYQVQLKSGQFDPSLLEALQKRIEELNEQKAELERESQEERIDSSVQSPDSE